MYHKFDVTENLFLHNIFLEELNTASSFFISPCSAGLLLDWFGLISQPVAFGWADFYHQLSVDFSPPLDQLNNTSLSGLYSVLCACVQ
jgi:hypothetical protein